MATDDGPGNRHVYGPRPIAALLPAVTRPAFRKRSPAASQLLADWAEIVGPKLASATTPRRFSAGTLTIACTGPVALELQHYAGPLAERINTHLGRVLVQRLRFVQDLQPPAPEPPSAPAPLQPVEVPGLPPGKLRDALATLGAAVQKDSA